MRRFFGWVFLLLCVGALGYGAYEGPLKDQPFEWFAIAEIWAELHRTSLIGLNSFVEKNLSPDVFDLFVLPVLKWPAAIAFGIASAVFFLLARVGRGGPKRPLMFPRR
jgi:hypothetical protein